MTADSLHIFLSYSRHDAAIMQQVRERLLAAGLPVWTDTGIEPGTRSWKLAIEQAILQAACVVCILSPEANQSQWVRAELEFAELHGRPVFLLLARGDERSAIPFGYAAAQWLDIRTDSRAALDMLLKVLRGYSFDPTPEESAAPQAPAEASAPLPRPALASHLPITDEIRAALDSLSDPDSSAALRAQAGDSLAQFGDPRRGVGIRQDGLPDIDWVKIPAGPFYYQQETDPRPGPGFFIGRYPITYLQFQCFVEAPDGYQNARWWEGLALRQDSPGEQAFPIHNHPRENLSWYDAMGFCRWLSARLHYTIRLPTDLEWEYAARGGDGRNYPWGEYYHEGYANVNDAYWGGGRPLMQTSAVGVYPLGASPFGLLDMGGNVWEWCANLYDDPHDPAPDAVGQRVLRGGSWYNPPEACRSFFRAAGDADGRTPLVGFRVARSAPGQDGV